jgi:hypothetical protein
VALAALETDADTELPSLDPEADFGPSSDSAATPSS